MINHLAKRKTIVESINKQPKRTEDSTCKLLNLIYDLIYEYALIQYKYLMSTKTRRGKSMIGHNVREGPKENWSAYVRLDVYSVSVG